MSTGFSWEGIRQVRATLLGARHVPEQLCGGRAYLGRYIKCSTFFLPFYTICCRLSVCLSVRAWVDQSKTVEAWIMQCSPYGR